MIGYIGSIILVISTFFGFFSGRLDDILSSLLSGGSEAINFCFKICGSICFFSGVVNVAEKAGITNYVSRILRPLICFLVPVTSVDPEIEHAVCMNIALNIFGIGNAATPIGIKAVELIRKRNGLSFPDRNISFFVVLNTVSLTIIPTTVVSIRASAGAGSPFSVTSKIFIVQMISCVVGILMAFLFCSEKGERGEVV